jgi:hypothetical protein
MHPRTAQDSKGEAKRQALEDAVSVNKDVKMDTEHRY